MSEAMSALTAVSSREPIDRSVSMSTPTQTVSSPVGFGVWFSSEVKALDSELAGAERAVQQLAAGATTSVHETMLQIEQARLQFQLAVQVRNRILEAYQEVMRMQV